MKAMQLYNAPCQKFEFDFNSDKWILIEFSLYSCWTGILDIIYPTYCLLFEYEFCWIGFFLNFRFVWIFIVSGYCLLLVINLRVWILMDWVWQPCDREKIIHATESATIQIWSLTNFLKVWFDGIIPVIKVII